MNALLIVCLTASDWRTPDPENTLYLDFAGGRVVIALAPQFAPQHVANIKTLVRGGYFDGLVFMRAQDNYVVQWGDANEKSPRSLGNAKRALTAELSIPVEKTKGFVRLPDADAYAPEVGFFEGFPIARDDKQAWLAHCYGTVGVGRDNDINGASGAELYAVIGHSPRHLDRNITVVGRVIQGIDLLSVLPRGKKPMGFYETPAQQIPITRIRVAADVPAAERVKLELLDTASDAFAKHISTRRNRTEPWFHHPVGHLDLCNTPLPTR
jgi:cyclophilin family peptidyl-prolyl cis-trans isomerase